MKRPKTDGVLRISRVEGLKMFRKTESGKIYSVNTNKRKHEWRMKTDTGKPHGQKVDLIGEYNYATKKRGRSLEDCLFESGAIPKDAKIEFTDSVDDKLSPTEDDFKRIETARYIYTSSSTDNDSIKKYFATRNIEISDDLISELGIKFNRYKGVWSVIVPLKCVDGDIIQIQLIDVDKVEFTKESKRLIGSAIKDRGLLIPGISEEGNYYIIEGLEDGLSCYLNHNNKDTYLITFGTSGFDRIDDFIINQNEATIMHDWDANNTSVVRSYHLGQRVYRLIPTIEVGYDANKALCDGRLKEWFESLRGIEWEEVERLTSQVNRYNFTEIGNGERFAFYKKSEYQYCGPKKTWFWYSGKYWKKDLNGQIHNDMVDVTRNIIEREKRPTDDEDWEKVALSHIMKSESMKGNKASLEAARSLLPVLPDELDCNTMLYNCKNGTLDLETGKLLKHNRKNNITKLVDIPYDPNAKCPQWLNFLDQIFDDDDLIEYIQKAVGYSLTGEVSEQCLHFMHGHGSNGKSTFINMIIQICKPYYERIRIETLKQTKGFTNSSNASPEIAKLKGTRMVIGSEVQSRMTFNASLAKDMTGNEELTGRFLHENEIKFFPEFKLWLYGNHKPIIRETDHGTWRRIRMIPFEKTFSNPDKNLPKKLETEQAGVLAWAVEGCLLWQKDGLGTPASIRDATKGYRTEMDTVGQFIDDECILPVEGQPQGKTEFRVQNTALYARFDRWASQTGEFLIPHKALKTAMGDRGFPSSKKSGAKCFFGLKLK